ncbi:hypothetical protein L484_027672 [Morus notabilis]|uniref:Uncharacterized protein n=1 Tax=Morus notabilis TaxID=981085 RepID=W9RCG4_9ROSA|nr:coilin [Morus notabilis]XP_024023961.1 coilin [Morus notabilis]EXB82497.1 hypothetical protein L484_027672 [Morus notabilis]
MEVGLRLRLVFEDCKMLTKSQRMEGLKRSWVLLKPHHETISEVADHLLRVFDIDDACSDGLVLSMDGFVLPPFESTSILKDKDIIRVKKKKGPSSTDIIGVGDGRKSFEVEEVAEEQDAVPGMKLLATEEFARETGGYESESEEEEPAKSEDLHIDNTPEPEKKVVSKKRKALQLDNSLEKKEVSNKRKASKKLKRSNDRKKRKKSATVEECSGTPEDVQNEIPPKKDESSHQHILLLENSPVKNDKSPDTDGELDYLSTTESDERTNNINVTTPSEKRSCEPQENGKKSVASSHTHDGIKKGPSRSTRRKRAKRQWLIERAKKKENELHQTKLQKTDNEQSSAKDNCITEEHKKRDKSDYEDGDVVPVVVRPGHIRFESSGKVDADQPVRQPEISMENFQWNGITSKRKGQKWGKEKTGFHKRSDQKRRNQDSSEMMIIEEETNVIGHVDFNKLKPCTSLPQEGDTVAYRLIELSPSWTPELSFFRVGKISKYDPKSDRITLVQVPEYPIVFEEQGDEASAAKPETSIYKEDGSLEVDYSSLVDVRIIKHGNVSAAKSVTAGVSQVASGDQGGASCSRQKSYKEPKGKEPAAPRQENGKVNVWDEICEALSAKKAQLSQEDNWTKKGGSSSGSWSFRALRGGALGPTMARLRAQNEI